jgi:TPR repeat protein
VPIKDFAIANEEVANKNTEMYYSCCGKSNCKGCIYSFAVSGNMGKCPFCKSEIAETSKEHIKELMKRVKANDAGAIYLLGNDYYHGQLGLLQDREKAIELWKQAATLGSSKAHFALGTQYDAEENSKKAKVHYEAAAIAGHDKARYNLGQMELGSGNMERAVKHWKIAASAGNYDAMQNLLVAFNKGLISRDAIESTLTAYNNSCAEMRSEARDAYIQMELILTLTW